MDAVLHVRPHKDRAEGDNPLPPPAGHSSVHAVQDSVHLLSCKCTLLAHVELFVHQNPQVLLCRAALNVFSTQSVHISGIAPAQVQQLAVRLIEPH